MGVLRHDGNACFAADTAALNSSFVVKGTCETTSCVAYHQDFARNAQYRKHFFNKLSLKRYGKVLQHLIQLTGFTTSMKADDRESTKLPPTRFGTLFTE